MTGRAPPPLALIRLARACSTLAWLILVTAPPGWAAGPLDYVVDAGKSQLRFEASSRFVNATGVFARFDAELRLDQNRPDAVTGRLTVDAASLDTRNRLRDDHLRSEDFFDADRHPTASFLLGSARRDGERWAVTGSLTIRGVTRPLALLLTVVPVGAGLRATGEFTINRRDFNIAYDSILNPIRNEVRVILDLTLVPRDASPASPRPATSPGPSR